MSDLLTSASEQFLRIADGFLFVFHLLLVLFNMLAWLWKPLRKAHFIIISLTLASWFILGIWYGWGYCPFTEWHWQILRELGYYNLPASYITFLIERVTTVKPNEDIVDILTLVITLLAFAISVKLNFFRKQQ